MEIKITLSEKQTAALDAAKGDKSRSEFIRFVLSQSISEWPDDLSKWGDFKRAREKRWKSKQ